MATTENEYYLRAILLLGEGGLYISKQVLYREHSDDFNKLLKGSERKLKKELHEKQIEKLFPQTGNTIVDTWDLQMLIIVVLRLFHNSLKHEDKRNLRVIKMLRHEVQAHSPSATLDDVQYDNIKDQLTDVLTSLASGFGKDVQEECTSFINKYTSGALDVISARECLKQLQNNDVLFKQVLEKIESSKNDICTRLDDTKKSLSDDVKNVSQQVTDLEKKLLEELQKIDTGACRRKIKVGMHVELWLGGPTDEWIHLMERTLNDVFNKAYKTCGGKFEDIKKRVEELLEDIKQNTTINFQGSNTGCIILMFECFTYSGLLDLLQYLTSQKYQRRLDALVETLSTLFKIDIPVTVTSTISPACLQNALDEIAEREKENQEAEKYQSHPSDENKKLLKLAMECSTVNDLVYLWKMFQQGGAAHYLDRIADALSEHSGERITLTSSLNLEEFKEALEDTVGSATDAEGGKSKITALKEDDSADKEERNLPPTTSSRHSRHYIGKKVTFRRPDNNPTKGKQWFLVVQYIMTLVLIINCVTSFILILGRFMGKGLVYTEFSSQFITSMGMFTSGLVSAFCVTLFDEDRQWFPRSDQNYLSWSFGLVVVSGFLAIFAAMCLHFDSLRIMRDHKKKKKEWRQSHTNNIK